MSDEIIEIITIAYVVLTIARDHIEHIGWFPYLA